MVIFFKKGASDIIAVESDHKFSTLEQEKLTWLFDGARPLASTSVKGCFIGPRKEMITPWSTNAVEITQNMGLQGISRIEQFKLTREENPAYDRMLQRLYTGLNSKVFDVTHAPEPIVHISDIAAYNQAEGLALSKEEEQYLTSLAEKLGRPLTDSEVFGFSQVNSEHCRHKIFNGTFVIDGEEKPLSLFKLIKKTSQLNPNKLVSAYKDNVAFVEGPQVEQFAPVNPDRPDLFDVRPIDTVISLKAETHNFPTTVEPFNGAATGTGGEIRDRLGGGRASLPIAGTAVYMTSYPRLDPEHRWELMCNPRVWLYQTPSDILIKASNGASDFGNKFGQPLICGSLLTFEHDENGKLYAYDKVIMLAGGVGFAARKDAIKGEPVAGEKVVVMGGDNYRIGMGGGAVSSVETGQYDNSIELNAVQRANPEMQKRVSNVIRALAEAEENPIVSIHDHGAGGHLNALSELVEATGGHIDLDALPVGDPTLSAKEIVGNESQERMGFVIDQKHIDYVRRVADRERAPMYVVGETTDDHRFVFTRKDGEAPIDLELADMFGNSPKTVMTDSSVDTKFCAATTNDGDIETYLHDVLSLEAVACKDWLTNKVDRSVTGKIARQQCQGEIQLPLSDCGVVALDYRGRQGIATSIGHAPQVALIDSAKGSVMAIAEALTNIAGAPIADGLKGISLSANWMWPCKNKGEDAALYKAVEACSDFACSLGINIPTGKDSLSMTQKYGEDKVYAPGTVIISAAGEVSDVRKTVSPVLANVNSRLYYIDFSRSPLSLGGSALAQTLNRLGDEAPSVASAEEFSRAFNAVQQLVKRGSLLAMHDVSAGGLVTTLLEMTFANTHGGIDFNTDYFTGRGETDLVKILFAENPAIVIQVAESKAEAAERLLKQQGVEFGLIGSPAAERTLMINHNASQRLIGIDYMRDVWFRTSYLLDSLQSGEQCARMRFENYKKQPLRFRLPKSFDGSLASRGLVNGRHEKSGIRAAIIREKGVNGDREMAYSLYLAGFDVKDVHMTDLMTGRETLDDVNMIVFCGGFSNSDVLGSAKGWAGGFLWNEKAHNALKRFYERKDTLSLGVCNGCQLMMELNLICPEMPKKATMEHNISHKFESQYLGVTIPENNSVMFGPLAGVKTGIWVAHGEGRFNLPMPLKDYNVVLRYNYSAYPGNPNGSRGAVAGLCSADGRHLAMMPHLERAIFPWQCANYPASHRNDDVTPWIDAFINARKWVEKHTGKNVGK
ncbi:MAG: phosphoribosylformylglycinamidine synthase [Firmicutes bacterium]|nr:phosphoribosylformylglycinamidine synthase [Bacillota bacterium]MCM1401862.1 phosphoribosylformylglycinamidine synthase [Bacteroides sp.]MCM1477736.1 phosphoribosylformylglycinamidine synthase [Bacteroides sp.]